MLSITANREERERLLVERNKFPIRIESGNPFMIPQEYDFLREETLGTHTLRSVTKKFELDRDVEVFRDKQIQLALNTLRRMPNNIQLINNLGVSYLNRGNFDGAIDHFQRALEINKNFFPALANMAKTYFLKKDTDEALRIYFSIEEIEPDNVHVLNTIGDLLFAKKDFSKALKYFDRASKIDQDNIAALNNIATIFLIEKKVDKAIRYLRRVIAVKPDLSGALNNLGVCFAIKRSYRKAIKHFLASRHSDPQAVGTLLNLAQAYQENKEYNKSIEILEDYLGSGIDDIRVRDALAWSYTSIKDYKNCLKQLNRSLVIAHDLEDHTKVAELFNNIATIYQCMEDYKNAEKYYSLCLESEALHTPIIFCNAIRLYLQINKDEAAKKLIDKGLVDFPEDPYILEFLGRYYFEKGDYDCACEKLKEVISIKPDVLDSYAVLSIIEIEINGDTKKAEETLKKGLSYNPGQIVLLNNLAYNFLIARRTDEARKILDKIKNQNDPILLATRGLLLIKEGNVKEGRRLYNLSIALLSKEDRRRNLVKQKKYLELGKYYLKEENKKEAVRLLKKALGIRVKYQYFKRQAEELLESSPI